MWEQCHTLICRSTNEDVLHPRLTHWKDNLSCTVLANAAAEGIQSGLIKRHHDKFVACAGLSPTSGKLVGSVQTVMQRCLIQRRWGTVCDTNPKICKEVNVRMKRWCETPNELNHYTHQFVRILKDHRLAVPPCVLFGFVQTVFYGWLTDARFRVNPVRNCVFCNVSTGDDQNHYMKCQVVWDMHCSLGLGCPPGVGTRVKHFLLKKNSNNRQLRMAFIHAVMVSVHKIRNGHCHIDQLDRGRKIKAEFKVSLSRHSSLRKLYNNLWDTTRHASLMASEPITVKRIRA